MHTTSHEQHSFAPSFVFDISNLRHRTEQPNRQQRQFPTTFRISDIYDETTATTTVSLRLVSVFCKVSISRSTTWVFLPIGQLLFLASCVYSARRRFFTICYIFEIPVLWFRLHWFTSRSLKLPLLSGVSSSLRSLTKRIRCSLHGLIENKSSTFQAFRDPFSLSVRFKFISFQDFAI